MSTTTSSPDLTALEKQVATIATSGANTIMNAAAGTEPSWAKPAVAIFAMALLAGVIAYAVITKDHDTMMLCVGAIISMATGAGNYYLGSSSGSAAKTNLLAASPAIPAATA
jgi:hypothetical protein